MGSESHKLSGARLEGKCAIVTGSATGIGKATATLFAQEGARVVVSDVDEAGRQVVEAIKGDGGEATFVGAIKALTAGDYVYSTYRELVLPEEAERYWKIEPSALKSQGKNTPFTGMELKGKVRYTLVEGQIVYEAN